MTRFMSMVATVAFGVLLAACGSESSGVTTAGETTSDLTVVTASDLPSTDPPSTDLPSTDPPPTDPPSTDPPSTDPPIVELVAESDFAVTDKGSGNCRADAPVGDDSAFVSTGIVDDDGNQLCDGIGARRIDASEIDDLVRSIGCWDDESTKDPALCSYKGLAAMEVFPDGASFANGSGPDIVYDLTPNDDRTTAECVRLADATAAGELKDSKCNGVIAGDELTMQLVIYRLEGSLEDPTGWLPAGTASFDAPELAKGTINHASVHVLVALSAGAPLGEIQGDSVLESAFLAGPEESTVSFSLRYVPGEERGLSAQAGRSLMVTIRDVGRIEGLRGAGCSDLSAAAAQLNCELQAGMEVVVEWDGDVESDSTVLEIGTPDLERFAIITGTGATYSP